MKLRSCSRVIAAIVVCFFTWTSGGIFSIVNAAAIEAKKPKTEKPAASQPATPEERLEKITEGMRATLGDDKASTERKKEKLKAGRAELDTVDAEIRKQFAETEKKLKDANLPAEIMERHRNFVKHYDDNMRELKGNIEQVEKAKDGKEAEAGIEKALKHLEKTKASSRHQKLDPNNLPHRQPKAVKREPRMKKEEFERDLKKDKNAWRNQKRIHVASTGSLSGLLSTDDLAETIDVQLTPEIRAKALELGNNPVKIYEWVRNNFKYETYYGSLKGAQQTLLEKSGNDFDQASLLIALLRAANIPARYASGTIEIPIERVMSWLGVKDPTTAANIIATGGIPAKVGMSGGKISTVRLEHVWVDAYVNMYPSFGAKNGPGNAWTPIDPSFKEHEIYPSVDISKIVKFNEADYLRTQTKLPPSLTYLFALEDYHKANYQGGMHEMFYLKRIKEHEFGILLGTLPYKTVVVGNKFAAIDPSMRHKISIGLRDPATGELANITKEVCELTGKQITVSFAPAGEQDSEVIGNYGGLLKTPAYLIKVKALVKLNDAVILEGPPVVMGESLKLSLHFSSPGSISDTIETDMATGVYYNIGISALNVANKQALGGLDNSENLIGTFYDSINSGDDQVGKVLHNIGLQYFTHTNNASKALEGVMHIQNTRAVNAGFVSVSAKYRDLFGLMVSPPIISGLVIDIPRYLQAPFSITGDKEQVKAFTVIQGLNTSFFEHAIWESFTGIDAVSTIKLLQLANEVGQPIYTITSENLNETLPLLNQTQQVKDEIQNMVATGKEVTIPGSYISRNEWTGTGYIVRNPDTGEGAYMISNGLAGGGSTSSPAPSALGLVARKYAVVAVGEATANPIHDLLSDFYWEVEIFSATIISHLLLSKGYAPRYGEISSKQDFLNVVNRSDNEIIFYNGHGTVPSSIDALVPTYELSIGIGDFPDPVPVYVTAADIHTNARIVFLNSCSSMHNRQFAGSFGPPAVNKVIMGWDISIGYWRANEFALKWWITMATTQDAKAETAAKAIDEGWFTTPSTTDPEKPTLVIHGDTNTTL